MKMTKKERKQFIRELEKKNKPNYELMMKAKLLWETIRRFFTLFLLIFVSFISFLVQKFQKKNVFIAYQN